MSDLQELFNRDPLSLEKQDLTRIITYFRTKRNFKAEVAPKLKKRATASKAPKVPVPGLEIDLGGL